MSDQGQWQVAGNAAEVYERALVPAVFAPWCGGVSSTVSGSECSPRRWPGT